MTKRVFNCAAPNNWREREGMSMLGMKALINRRKAPAEARKQRAEVIRIRELTDALAESRKSLEQQKTIHYSYTDCIARWSNHANKAERCIGLRSA